MINAVHFMVYFFLWVGWRSPNWPYLHQRRAGDAGVVRGGMPPELQIDRGCRYAALGGPPIRHFVAVMIRKVACRLTRQSMPHGSHKRGVKNVDRVPSWCRPNPVHQKPHVPFLIQSRRKIWSTSLLIRFSPSFWNRTEIWRHPIGQPYEYRYFHVVHSVFN